jgi:hypothetical protein
MLKLVNHLNIASYRVGFPGGAGPTYYYQMYPRRELNIVMEHE